MEGDMEKTDPARKGQHMNIQRDLYIYMYERSNEHKNKNLKKRNYFLYSTDCYELALFDKKHSSGILRL